MEYWFVIIAAIMGGIIWRLGGGAFTTITGWNFGTDAARLLRASVAIPLPFVGVGWFGLAPLACFIGICIGGWGPFQGMGLPVSGKPEASWKRWLPNALGFQAGTLAHDFMGMMQAGLCCVAPLGLLFGWFDWRISVCLLAVGLGFAPCYLLSRLPMPTIPRFASGGEWGEVFTGALIGAAFVLIGHFCTVSWSVL